MDPRTGLGRFRDYRISNYQLMYALIDLCATKPIEEILALPDVKERVDRYFEQEALFRGMLEEYTWTEGNAVITDLRGVTPIYSGNRFLIYALYPEQNTSIWVVDGVRGQNVVFACGHSILNRSSWTHVGLLMRRFGGGGHEAVGTCQVAHEVADATLRKIVEQMNRDEWERVPKVA
jgi:nanoRNase/pAp phosphatase (c-di-AMP/oligoRNAs hydrolase)